jgi:DNA-binding beta-propeller fold protein YncE
MRSIKLLAGAALLSGMMAGSAFAQSYHFKLVDKISLPGKPGHGDFVRYDPTDGYIYVSLPNGGAVVDTHTNKVIHYFKSISSPNSHASDKNYVYWTVADGPGKTNQIVVISKKDWKIVNRVTTEGTSPDGMWLDPGNHKLYIAMDDNNWIDVYSTGHAPKFETKIPLYPAKGSGPDVGTLVPSKNILYMPDDSWEEAININTDKITHKVNTHVKITKLGGTKGQIYDPKTNTVWVGSTTGGVLVFNADTLKIIKRLPSKGGIDQVSFDPKLNLVYAFDGGANGVDVYNANTMAPVTFISTGIGLTHTGTVDLANNDIYAYAGKADALYVYKPEK